MAQTKLKPQALTQNAVYGKDGYGQGSDNTIANATFNYINQAGFKADITVKNGGTVLVFLTITGWTHSNAGYSTVFDIGMDGLTTKSNSGQMDFASQGYSGMGQLCCMFVFTGVTPGAHTFYPIWNSSNAANTSKIATWATTQVLAVEVQAPLS